MIDMANQFDNGFYGDQPQRPFTEKNEPEVPVQPVTDFQPEKPLMQQEQPAPAPAPAQSAGVTLDLLDLIG